MKSNSFWGSLALIAFSIALLLNTSHQQCNFTPVQGDVFKTVAHITLSNENIELLFVDDVHDIAYYRYTDDESHPNVGSHVITCNGDVTIITALDVYGFYVKADNKFYPGMSGTVIRDTDGNSVGYVSGIVDSKTVYCIWD